jgi:hypothetical protein
VQRLIGQGCIFQRIYLNKRIHEKIDDVVNLAEGFINNIFFLYSVTVCMRLFITYIDGAL